MQPGLIGLTGTETRGRKEGKGKKKEKRGKKEQSLQKPHFRNFTARYKLRNEEGGKGKKGGKKEDPSLLPYVPTDCQYKRFMNEGKGMEEREKRGGGGKSHLP